MRASTAPPPPPVWSRSPSEYYIKYVLTADKDHDIPSLVAIFQEQGVILPPRSVEYLQQLEARLDSVSPDPFYPEDLRHRASQKCLRDEGIWTMWHPSPATREAQQIFDKRNMRENVNAMLVSGFGAYQISKLLSMYLGLTCSEAAIEEYRHYFWKIELLTVDERDKICNDAKAGSVVFRASQAAQSITARAAVAKRLGIPVEGPSPRAVFEDLISEAGDCLANVKLLPIERRPQALLAISQTAINGLRGIAETKAAGGAQTVESFIRSLQASRIPIEPVRSRDIGTPNFRPKGLPGRGAGSGDYEVIDTEESEEGDGKQPVDCGSRGAGSCA